MHGFKLLEEGHYQNALNVFEAILDTDNNNVTAWLYKGMTLFELRQFETI